MNRYIILTASALALTIAGSASASQMTVRIAGKTTAQAYLDIREAAKTVCSNDLRFDSMAQQLMASCVKEAVSDAVAQANDPALASFSRTQPRGARLLLSASR